MSANQQCFSKPILYDKMQVLATTKKTFAVRRDSFRAFLRPLKVEALALGTRAVRVEIDILPIDCRKRFEWGEATILRIINHPVRSGMGTYAGAARRRVHLATVLLRTPSGHRPGRGQARHAHIPQIGLHHD